MNVLAKCPPAEHLQRVAAGGGTDAEVEQMAEHLEQCERCGAAIDACLASDPGVANLRLATAGELPQDQAMHELANRLRNLRPAADAALAKGETLIGGKYDTSTDGARPNSSSANFKFLAPPLQEDEVGRLGNYRVLKQLGIGGMGVVFLAEDLLLHRKVALKTMLPSLAADPQAKERFLREARAAAAVEHEHVVAIYQVGEDRGVPFLAMPFLKGETLHEKLEREGKLPVAEALRIVLEMAEGLSAAHERELIHRDIKPANVWLEGGQGKVKLLDFGLARAQGGVSQLTQSGAIVGTPAFMAPEQARGEKLDDRADLFSLGAVLYLMLTGRRPFEGGNTITVLTALALHNPPPPAKVSPELPAPISKLTMRLLSKQPGDRPATARATVQEIKALQVTPPAQPAATGFFAAVPMDNAANRRRPPKTAVIAAAVLGVAVLAGGYIFKVQTDRGEIVIESQDAAVEVTVRQSGREPVVVVVDKNTQKSIELKPGNGEIDAKELPDGVRFKTRRFELQRGSKTVFTAEMLLAARPAKGVEGATAPAEPNGPKRPAEPGPVAPAAAPQYVEAPELTSWIKKVSGLTPAEQVGEFAKKLQELNPGYDGTGDNRIEGGVVTYLRVNTDRIVDISPVRAFPRLLSLNLGSSRALSGSLVDLSPLSGMKLQELILLGNRVSDLSALKGMKLTTLNCGCSRVDDLAPLAGMPLECLECDLAPIQDFAPLRTIRLRRIQVAVAHPEKLAELLPILRDIKTLETINNRPAGEVLREQTGLAELAAALGRLKDANPQYDGTAVKHVIVQGHVTELTLRSHELRDLSPLQKLPKLTVLEIGLGAFWHLSDLSGLQGLPLTALGMNGASVVDLTPLKGMPLKALDMHHTKVRDLSPLQGMPLEFLNCEATAVNDFTPLQGAPLRELFWSSPRPAEFVAGIKSFRPIKTLKTFNTMPASALDSYIAGLAALAPVVEKLQTLNPTYNGIVRSFRVEQGQLTELSIEPHDELRHLAPLKELTALKALDLNQGAYWSISDLSELQGLQLESLGLQGAQLTDLAPLNGMPLTYLNISHTKVQDLSPLAGMLLKTLVIQGDTPVTDLAPLAKTPLFELVFERFDRERDLRILKSIKSLEKINGKFVAELMK